MFFILFDFILFTVFSIATKTRFLCLINPSGFGFCIGFLDKQHKLEFDFF